MLYPTLEEVESATKHQLGVWYRFLPSPGMNHIGDDHKSFRENCEKESQIMKRICERFEKMGFFDPELSKEIGQ